MVQLLVQILKIATVIVVSTLVVLGGARAFERFQDEARPDDIGRSYTISIADTDEPADVAQKLDDAGIINSQTYFKTRLRIINKDLAPGAYRLQKGMTVSEIVDAITSDESPQRTDPNAPLTITVIEGWRTEQIAEELVNLGWTGTAESFVDAARNYPSDSYAFLADRPEGSSLEGYLFPDTYEFKADSAPEDIIQAMLDNFDVKVTEDMRVRASEMGLSLQQVLTFASLVEREAQVADERPIIADVYLKRFEEGWELEADPTVQYVVGNSENWWPELSEDDLFAESPYNTYQNIGLPPGPIANPGYSSIRSVLFPTDSPYYFFFARADGSGTHLFATTSEEQQQNINFVAGEASEPAPGSDPFAN
jgi:peptidoglycan lytic transglycosylase G